MDSLNNWITASFQLALMFYVVKVLMGVKYNIRDYIFMIGIIIPSNIVYTFIGTDTLILVIILSIIFFYRKMKFFIF